MPDLSCVIADDEPLALQLLESLVQPYEDIKIIAACRDGLETLSAIRKLTPDLAILDIEMPGLDGFDVVKRLQDEISPAVIFATAFNQYAIEAFDIHAVDYILKPLNSERLGVAIERARLHVENRKLRKASNKGKVLQALSSMSQETKAGVLTAFDSTRSAAPDAKPRHLLVRDSGKTHVIDRNSIDWVDAAGDYMCIHVGPDTLVARMTMKSLEEQLKPGTFVRIHRSTLVNIDKIDRLEILPKGDFILHLQGGAQIRGSRRFRNQLMELLILT